MEGLSDIKRVQEEILREISEVKLKLDNEVKERLDIVDDIYKAVDRVNYSSSLFISFRFVKN